jgi:multidrug efflux pump subunit AcrA (membrane-fusion protein)
MKMNKETEVRRQKSGANPRRPGEAAQKFLPLCLAIGKRNCWLLAGLLCFAGCGKKEEEEAKPKPLVAVKVATAETAEIRLAVKAPASLWPREQANISARITAPIRELRVHKGDTVAKNQVLAVLEDRDLAAQREEAAAAVTDAEANLQKTTAGSLPTDIERARGQVETTEAALNQAQKIYERRSELFKQGAIPSRDLLQSQTELAQARTNAEVAKRSMELLRTQSGEKDIAIARSKVAQARAHLNAAQAQLQFTELRSPFAGTITEQLQYPGDMAQPGSTLFTVMDLAVLNARAQVPEDQLSRVHTGQPCQFISGDAPEPAGGRVTLINKAVDAQRRTVEVWCEIPNAGNKFRANIFGEVSLFVGNSGGVVVPQPAVQFNEGTRTGNVMVVDDKKIAHKREIEAGEVRDGKVQIAKGVNAGEKVIVEGAYGLPDGTEVTLGEPSK